MVRPNLVKRSLKEGKLVVGAMIAEFRSPGLARMMANATFDFMSIDMEHPGFSPETVAERALAARGAWIRLMICLDTHQYVDGWHRAGPEGHAGHAIEDSWSM